MPEPITEVGAAWAGPAVAGLLVLALTAATLEAALSARAAGRPVAGDLLAPLGETARLLRQRRRRTVRADGLLWRIGGAALLVAACMMVAVIPVGSWVLADLSVGVVWFNAADVLVWSAVWLAGWGPNSIHALVGGYRFLAQALAHELPLMFALTAPAVAAGSLRVADISADQQGIWNIVWMPGAFAVYCIGVAGFAVWGPLAAAHGADIGGGVLAELSGPDRLVVQVGRYALLAAGAAFAVPLFLGGGGGPLLPAAIWTGVKAGLVLGGLVLLGRHLPLLRPDRLISLGWLVLLPAVLVQLLVVTVIAVGQR